MHIRHFVVGESFKHQESFFVCFFFIWSLLRELLGVLIFASSCQSSFTSTQKIWSKRQCSIESRYFKANWKLFGNLLFPGLASWLFLWSSGLPAEQRWEFSVILCSWSFICTVPQPEGGWPIAINKCSLKFRVIWFWSMSSSMSFISLQSTWNCVLWKAFQ